MTEQLDQINRVRSQIGHHIEAFLGDHLNQEFHADDMRRYVAERVNGYIAPASADRILRDLRQKGVVNYKVTNRRQSLYRALPVTPQGRLF